MSKVDIYTKGHCPYCHRAKALLTKKEVNFNEIEIDVMPEFRSTMIERANGKSTVPQIFIKDHQHQHLHLHLLFLLLVLSVML